MAGNSPQIIDSNYRAVDGVTAGTSQSGREDGAGLEEFASDDAGRFHNRSVNFRGGCDRGSLNFGRVVAFDSDDAGCVIEVCHPSLNFLLPISFPSKLYVTKVPFPSMTLDSGHSFPSGSHTFA